MELMQRSPLARQAALLLSLAGTSLTAAEPPTRGGLLRVALRAEPRTLNPALAIDAPSREVLRRLHSDLITIDRATQKTVPALAESWTHSPDGKRYTLKLRKNLKFSDGAPFTADDVLFSWTLYLDPSSPQRDLLIIDGKPIEAHKIDETTVTFEFPQPYAPAERLFDSIAMLPRHKLEAAWKSGKLRDAWPITAPPSEIVGLGPFRLKEFKPGQAVVLERNPYYWRANQPYLDGIEFRLLADEDLQLARFVSGDLDILNRLSMKSVDFLKSKGAEVTDLGPSLEYNFLCFNLSSDATKPWFQSREFRLALSQAVDRDAIVKLVYQNRATPLSTWITPGNRLWRDDKLKPIARSLPKAKELLKTAGFHWDSSNRLTDNTGKRVEFSIVVSSSSAERQQMATIIQADLEQLGIAVNIIPLEFRSLYERVANTRQFNAVIQGLGGGDVDPTPEMNVWLSSGGMHLWNPNQKQPATKWEAEVDGLMRQQMVTLNPIERKKLYDKVQDLVVAESPMIFLASPHIVVAQRGAVGNFRPAILNHFTLWNANELYLRQGGSSPR